jgi:hypothetical protein
LITDPSHKTNGTIDLFDFTGKKLAILDKNFDFSTNTTQLKMPSKLASGTYLIKIDTISKIIIVQ